MKEKSQQLKDLVHLHQKQKDRIQDYEGILYKVVQFHQVREEVRLVMDIRKTLSFKYEIKNKLSCNKGQIAYSDVRSLLQPGL